MRALSLMLSALALHGCLGFSCTEMGCISSLVIDVPEQWFAGAEPGDVFTLVLDAPRLDAPLACTFTWGELENADCLVQLDGGFVSVELFPFELENVEVVDARLEDGEAAALFDESIALEWGDGFRPNGPRCAPVCYNGIGTLPAVE